MAEVKAIRTKYKGILFRSKLEAEWAKFLDYLNIEWIYEPEGFVFSNGITYLPDFYLPMQDCFLEVKGIMNEIDYAKIKTLATETKKSVVIGESGGRFSIVENEYNWGWKDENEVFWFEGFNTWLGKCNACNKYSFFNNCGSWMCRIPSCKHYDSDNTHSNVLFGDKCSEEWKRFATIDYRNMED